LNKVPVLACVLALLISFWVGVLPVAAAPGLCVGPICGDEITRSAKHHFQLRMRLSDQLGHRERITIDCRTVGLSPAAGLVERGYAAAVARKACRLAGESA
jgi:hypothetical protein